MSQETNQMPSFQISPTPSRRAAARFVNKVRRAIQKALAEEKKKGGISQSDVAREIGIHRSVISREINGYSDISLGRVAEIAHALGRVPKFELADPVKLPKQNYFTPSQPKVIVTTASSNSAVDHKNPKIETNAS